MSGPSRHADKWRGAVEVHTPHSPMRQPFKLIANMARALWASRELAWRLFLRDLSAQYRQSALGYVWAILPPLAAAAPFIFLQSGGVMRMAETPIPYAAFALIGTLIWQTFVDAVNAPLRTVLAAKPMLARINVASEGVLLSGLYMVLFGLAIRMALLVGAFIVFGLTPTSSSGLFIVGAGALILVGFVLGLAITPIGVLYTDVQSALPIFTTLAMMLTPVVYPIPEGGAGAIVAALNPLTPLLEVTRDWLIGVEPSQIELVRFAWVSGIAAILLIVAWAGFRVAKPHIIARLGT
jgi:lipopolysaccharide transport system permease protein